MECLDCGRFFDFPSQLKSHLQRKTPCTQKVPFFTRKIPEFTQKVPDDGLFHCTEGCGRCFMRKYHLERHLENRCRGNPNQCEICKKIFKTPKGRWQHNKTVVCKSYISPKDELRLRVEELEEKLEEERKKPKTIVNNTYNAPVYNITYDSGKKMMLCDNPDMVQNRLLCIDAFDNPRSAKEGIDDLPIDDIRKQGEDLLESGGYDIFYNFFFRNAENKVLQNMIMSPNPGATHCSAFKDGKIIGVEKTNMFEQAIIGITNMYHWRVSQKIGKVIYVFLNNKTSRNCFYNTIRQDSKHFETFKEYLVEEPE